MDNPETNEWTIQRQIRMDNPETNEWTIQRQRLTKQNAQHRKLKRFSNTDLTNKTRMNSCAQEV